MIYIDAFHENNIVIQRARCSFDAHIQEIIGTLMTGAAVVMVHPGGTLDFDYLSSLLEQKQITSIDGVPSFFQSFFTFLREFSKEPVAKHLRLILSGGMFLGFSMEYSISSSL